MRRRELLGLMGAVPAFPISALAQPSRRIVKIGHMELSSPSGSPELLAAFRERLRELGYVEGQNLFIERRYAEGEANISQCLLLNWFALASISFLPLALTQP